MAWLLKVMVYTGNEYGGKHIVERGGKHRYAMALAECNGLR